jgi:mRNA degradation ribonuclease J1/J2
MNAERPNEVGNPLAPAALEALRRAAQHARIMARKTGTAIVISRNGEVIRIEGSTIREAFTEYTGDILGDRNGGGR